MTGAIWGGCADRVGAAGFAAVDSATGRNIGPDFHEAGAADVADAAALADRAFAAFHETAPEARALFLEAIAEEITPLGPALLDRAMHERGLPRARPERRRRRRAGPPRQFHPRRRSGGRPGASSEGPRVGQEW